MTKKRKGYHAHGGEGAPPELSTLVHSHGEVEEDHVHVIMFTDHYAYRTIGTVHSTPAIYWTDDDNGES